MSKEQFTALIKIKQVILASDTHKEKMLNFSGKILLTCLMFSQVDSVYDAKITLIGCNKTVIYVRAAPSASCLSANNRR